jgi:hypothetical protein
MRWRGEEVLPVALGKRQARFFTADGDGLLCAGDGARNEVVWRRRCRNCVRHKGVPSASLTESRCACGQGRWHAFAAKAGVA